MNHGNIICDMLESLENADLPMSMVVAWDHHGRAAWEACEDARELLRLLTYVDHNAAVLAACACARTALKYIPPGEDRPLKAIQTAEAWTRGEATEEQCREAASAARAAAARAADAAWAAAHAASAAASAAAYAAAYAAAAAAAHAAAAAAHAAVAAAHAAADAELGSNKWQRVYDQTLRELADVVRSIAQCPTTSQVVISCAIDEACS